MSTGKLKLTGYHANVRIFQIMLLCLKTKG